MREGHVYLNIIKLEEKLIEIKGNMRKEKPKFY